MALPNIGNPQDPPKRDGDLVNNSEGCPPPGDKEWRVKDIKLNRYTLGQGVVPISPHNGFHDLDVDLNNPMFQTEPVKDNDYAAKVLEAGKEFRELSNSEQEEVIQEAKKASISPLFPVKN